MKPKSSFDSNFISRVEHLMESTRPPYRHNTPLLNPKPSSSISENSCISSQSFYEKYSKIWSSRSFPRSSLLYLSVLHKKLQIKYKSQAFRKLSRAQDDPLSVTRCMNCGHAALTLLTSSTQERFSPRFMSKIKSILPKSNKNQRKSEKSNSSTKRKSNDSVVIHSEKGRFDEFSPEQKMKINDLSEIAPNPYFLSSLSSPEQVRERKTARDEISFEISRDSFEVRKEMTNLPKQLVPKLRLRPPSRKDARIFQEFERKFKKLSQNQIRWAFQLILKTTPSEKTKQKDQVFQGIKKNITNSKKTAFKILHSRLEKFLFRRKMQGFYAISEILYR